MDNKTYTFDELTTSDLFIDALYLGGRIGNAGDDALHKLLGVANMGGFRPRLTRDRSRYAFIVLYSSNADPDWPDSIDFTNGTLLYYGDNKKPGGQLEETSSGGNRILSNVFDLAHGSREDRLNVPPFLVFTKGGLGRDVIFRGLAVPGAISLSQTEDLVAVWKVKDGQRFQNYRSVFTILDESRITQVWLEDCIKGDSMSANAPNSWTKWIKSGEYNVLRAEPTIEFRNKYQQLPNSNEEQKLLQAIYSYFSVNPYAFERFAAALVQKMDPNIEAVDLTRPYLDGGRDALGKYRLGLESDPILVDFALEAKCYNSSNPVGVKETARLISRLRYRQFGILVTTSYVAQQAYKEIREDGHPVIIISGSDIVNILRRNGLGNISDLSDYLKQFPL